MVRHSSGLAIPPKSPQHQGSFQNRKYRLPSRVASLSPALSPQGGGSYRLRYLYGTSRVSNWPSRDPIEEDGGLNLYGMVGNNAISRIDFLGMQEFCYSDQTESPCCICALEPKKCSILISWRSRSTKAEIATSDPVISDGVVVTTGTKSRTVKIGLFGVRVLIYHSEGKSVKGCHLKSSTERKAIFDLPIKFDGKVIGTSSAGILTRNPADMGPVASAGNELYIGHEFSDSPAFEGYEQGAGIGSLADMMFFWQSHIHIAEAPSVENWYGYSFIAHWKTNGVENTKASLWFDSWVGKGGFSYPIGSQYKVK